MWQFRTWFSSHGGIGLTVGLDDVRGLFQPERYYDSKIVNFRARSILQTNCKLASLPFKMLKICLKVCYVGW